MSVFLIENENGNNFKLIASLLQPLFHWRRSDHWNAPGGIRRSRSISKCEHRIKMQQNYVSDVCLSIRWMASNQFRFIPCPLQPKTYVGKLSFFTYIPIGSSPDSLVLYIEAKWTYKCERFLVLSGNETASKNSLHAWISTFDRVSSEGMSCVWLI